MRLICFEFTLWSKLLFGNFRGFLSFLYRLRDLDDVRLILGFKEIRGNILCRVTPYFSSSSHFNCVKYVRF